MTDSPFERTSPVREECAPAGDGPSGPVESQMSWHTENADRNPQARHPDAAQLSDFVEGRLDEAASAVIERHLEQCASCCGTLSGLSAGDDRFVRELLSAVRLDTEAPATGEALSEKSTACRPPARVGRFDVRGEVGRGSFGVVLLAWDTMLCREVALKVPRMGAFLNNEMRHRFLREAQAAAALDHPSIVPIYEAGQEGDTCFIAAAHCRGPNLDNWLKDRQEPVPIRTAAWLIAVLADAVEHAHSRGVLHRDLKPGNVLLEPVDRATINGSHATQSGSAVRHSGPSNFPFVPRLTDFGLAKLMEEGPDSTRSNVVLGTAAYMSPEQARGQARSVGPTSDVYSLGAMLYQLLTGQPPLVGETEVETILRVQRDDPVPPVRLRPQLPQDLETICLKCLEKGPERRYQSAGELSEDLIRFLRGDAIVARRPRWSGLAWRWCRRNPLPAGLWTLSALLLVALVAGSIVTSIRLKEQHQATVSQLGETQAAEARAREQSRESRLQLFNALLAESRARRLSGRMGQKFENMESLERAAELARDLDLPQDNLRRLRSELISTMALTDLRVDREWTAYPSGSSISGVAFDSQIERYAMVDSHGRIVVRHTLDNERLTEIDTHPPRSRNSDWRLNLRFSPDGRFIAGGHTETPPHEYGLPTRVWDLTTSELIITVDGDAPRSGSFDFSPDSRLFASGCNDGSIAVYDLESRLNLHLLRPRGFPHTLQFSPDGEAIAICHGNRITVVSIQGDVDLATHEHPDRVLSVAWDATGERIASGTGGVDDCAYVWDLSGSRQADFKGHGSDILHIDFSPDGGRLVTTSWRDSRIWDALTGRELLFATGNLGAFSGDGRWLQLGHVGARVGRWEVASPEGVRQLRERLDPDVPGLTVSPDGRLLMSTDQNRILFWELSTGRLLQRVTLPNAGEFLRAAFDPFGNRLVTASRAGLHVWPIVTGDSEIDGLQVSIGPPVPVSLMFERELTDLVISGDGRALVGDGLEVRVVDIDDPEPAVCVRRFRDTGWGMAGSRDGRWLATSTFHGYETRLWDMSTGRRISGFDGRSSRVAFSPDDRWLWISTDNGYSAHAVGTWEQQHAFPSLEIKGAWPLAYCDNGGLMAIAPDGVPRLLDTETLEELATFLPPGGERAAWLAFDPRGDYLCAKTSDGAILVWDLREIRGLLRRFGVDWSAEDLHPESGTSPGISLTVHPGEFAEIDTLTRLIAEDEQNADACYRRGLARMRFRIWADAVDDFSQALAQQPDNLDARYQRGVAQLRLGAAAEAESEFTRVIESSPDHAAAHQQRAEARRRQRDWGGALADFTRVAELQPNDWRIWFERGGVRFELEQWEETVADFTRAIEQNPSDLDTSRAFTFRGIALDRLGRFAEARDDGERALRADPESWSCCNNLAWLLATCPDQTLRDPERAIELAQRSIGLRRQNGLAWNTLGVAYLRAGQWDESRDAFEESMRLRAGGDSFDWFFMAMLEGREKDIAGARDWYQRSIEWMKANAPDDPELEMFREEAQQFIRGQ